jgi:predicted  nucleic acid-binding Zn-ribbon protein
MADRLKNLLRIAEVQKQMVRLSEWRLAAADRTCRDLAADQARLQGYVVEEGALGVSLAKSALRSLHRLDRRLGDAERRRDNSKAALDASKRREHAVNDMTESARRAAERAQEDRELALTLETWLAAKDTSLR